MLLLLLVLLEYSLKENILAMPLRKVFKNDFLSLFILLIYLMSVGNERTTYLRGLEVAELKEEDMLMV